MRFQPLVAAALAVSLAACVDTPTASSGTSSGPSIEPGTSPTLAMNASSARVVAYLPNWYTGSLNAIPFNKITHVIYAFVDVNTNGTLASIPMDGDARLDSVVSKAHAAGAKVLISVGGGGASIDSNFEPMAASATARATFVDSIVAFVNNYALDGVDIDWEFPDDATEAANHATLMGELDTAMHSRGKLLTAAVAANGWFGRWIQNSVLTNVDFMTVMAYDGSIASASVAHADSSLLYWAGRGLSQSRTVLGVQFYGVNGTGSEKPYRTIVRDDPSAPGADLSNGWHYNGLATMKTKTGMALGRASGIGIWHIAHDSAAVGISLLDAIHDVMNTSKVVYDDARGAGWDNWSWGTTVSYAATSPVHLGSKSISAAYTQAWGGLYLHNNSGVSPSGNTKLEFWVHGGTAGGQNLIVQLADTGGWRTMVPLNGYVAGGSVAAGTWRKVSIPLSTLGITTLAITDLVIQDNSGGAQPVYYVDQVQFIP
jgi:GH18 family chitinase